MSPRAVCLSGVYGRGALPAYDVFTIRDGLKMVGVDATSNAAQVIQNKGSDWSLVMFVEKSVYFYVLAASSHIPVSLADCPHPYPASRLRYRLIVFERVKPIVNCHHPLQNGLRKAPGPSCLFLHAHQAL